METETIRYLLLRDNHVIASLDDPEPLRSIGTQLAKINGEHYHLAALTETIDPPKGDEPTATALQALHPWLLNHGHTASVQEILDHFTDGLAEMGGLPMNAAQYMAGPFFGIIRGLRRRFSDAEIADALAKLGITNATAWPKIQGSLASQYEALTRSLDNFNGDMDAAIAAWIITRDDKELSFVINQAEYGKSEIRQSAARWALNNLSLNPDVHSALCRLIFTPDTPPSPF